MKLVSQLTALSRGRLQTGIKKSCVERENNQRCSRSQKDAKRKRSKKIDFMGYHCVAHKKKAEDPSNGATKDGFVPNPQRSG